MTPGRVARCAALLAALVIPPAGAGEVEIVAAEFVAAGPGVWRVNVTLRHADTGWDHYADAWRVVDGAGRVLGTRTLYHPHVEEQPFARSLGGVAADAGATVYVEAHDKVHGWSPARLAVDLGADAGPGYTVKRR